MRALHLCALTTQEPRANICQQQNAFKPQVAYAAVLSRVVVLMLLIRCLLLLPLWDSFVVPCFVVLLLCKFSLCNHQDGEDRGSCFALFVFLVSGDCCVALPCGVTGLSAACDCGIC